MVDGSLENSGGFRFQLSEYREMKQIVSHKADMIAFADAVYALKQIRKDNPDLTWEQVVKHDERYAKLHGKGFSILEKTYSIFQESKAVSAYWSNKVKESNGLNILKSQLHMIANFSVKPENISWQDNCCVVRVDSNALNTYYRKRESEGGKTVPPNTRINAYVASYLYLEDDEGRKCPVVLINNQTQQSTVDHETEHVLFYKYYWRIPYEDNDPGEYETPRQDAKNDINERIANVPPEYMVHEAKKSLGSMLQYQRALFYTETLSEIAGNDGGTEFLNFHPSRARDFSPDIRYGDLYSIYATEIRDHIEGIKDALIDKKVPYATYAEIAFELEKQAALFVAQNTVIENWIAELIKCQPDKDRRLAILESIPLNHIEAIGYFIGKEPLTLVKDLQPQEEKKKLKPWDLPREYPGLDEIYEKYYKELASPSPDTRDIKKETVEEQALLNFAATEKKRGKPKQNIQEYVKHLLPQTTIDVSSYEYILSSV